MGILKFLNTIDRRALLIAVVGISVFLFYVSSFNGRAIYSNISDFMWSSHASSGSPDFFCSKKENWKSSFCLARKSAVNDKWNDVVSQSQGSRKTTAFGLTH